MASTPTSNFAYQKPAEGDTDWDTTINGNWDLLDADLIAEHNANGTHKAATFSGAITMSANFDLNGYDLILDADADSYLHASADDVIDLVLAGASGEFAININAAEDFTFTANAFNVLAGSGIVMGQGCTIGQAAGPLLAFDDTNNELVLSGGNLNYDFAAVTGRVHIEKTAGALNTVTQANSGLLLTMEALATGYFTPGVLFGSTDAEFTTTNPKVLAGIFGMATEAYAADTDSGMSLEFYTTPNDAGATPSPSFRMTIDEDGFVGINVAAPLGQLHVDQASTSGAIPVLLLDQADVSEGFINFVGTSAASAAGPISSWTVGATLTGYYRVEINGAQYWAPYYTAPSS